MYKNVHNITAGAGAGKTTELVRIITRLVKDLGVSPRRMILTTFTVAAATEFRERSKAALPVEKAIEMNAAQMGTLHSLAEKYIHRYWYLLGISPAVNPADESVSGILMDRSLEDLVTGEQVDLLKKYVETFGITKSTEGYDYDFWKTALKEMLKMLRRYGFGKERIPEFRKKTLSLLKDTFRQDGNKALLDQARLPMQQYCGYRDAVNSGATPAGAEAFGKNCAQIAEILRLDPLAVTVKDLEKIKKMTWGRDIAFAVKSAENSRYADEIKACKQSVKDAAEALGESLVPKEHSMILDVAGLLFDLLPEWMDAYTSLKKESGVIDFSDMEEMFLELLGMPEVLEDIEKSVYYLFVDEFQDTNPIQARIYDIISNHIRQSWFVGDRKQAIYGFSGSDAGLISELTRTFPDPVMDTESFSGYRKDGNGNSSQILDVSHRSVKTLVDAANAIFIPAFAESGKAEDVIPAAQVRLQAWDEIKDTAWDSLYHVNVEGGNATARADAVASFVCGMIGSDGFKKAGYSTSDIAILTRSGTQARGIGNALARKNIPTAFIDTEGFRDTPEVSLLLAILKLSEGVDVQLCRAEIRKLVRNEDLALLAENIKSDGNNLDGLPGLEAFSRSLRRHSVPDRVNEIIARCDLYGLCGHWGNPDSRRGHLDLVRSAAKSYADKSMMLCIEAGVRGFLSFLDGFKPDVKFDNTAEGVKVLTCHKAKGLEWKIVLLYGIDDYKEDTSIAGITIEGPLDSPDSILFVPRLPDKAWTRDCIAQSPAAAEVLTRMRDSKLGEEKRLLYVGFTRAKEAVVTVAQTTSPGVVTTLCPTALDRKDVEPTGDRVDIWGVPGFVSRYASFADDPDVAFTPTRVPEKYKEAGISLPTDSQDEDVPVKYNSPSTFHDKAVEESATVETAKDFGARTDIPHPGLEDNVFGDCMHHIFAVCSPGAHEQNMAVAERTLNAYGIGEEGAAEKAVGMIEKLYAWLEDTYGPMVAIEHEIPVRYTDGAGRVFSGNMDFIWRTEKGSVLIDYKTFPGKRSDLFNPDSKHWAGGYASQLHVYATALSREEHGTPMDRLLYYPVEGLVIRVK